MGTTLQVKSEKARNLRGKIPVGFWLIGSLAFFLTLSIATYTLCFAPITLYEEFIFTSNPATQSGEILIPSSYAKTLKIGDSLNIVVPPQKREVKAAVSNMTSLPDSITALHLKITTLSENDKQQYPILFPIYRKTLVRILFKPGE